MQIIEENGGNSFTLDGKQIAHLSDDPLDSHPFMVQRPVNDKREAAVIAHAMLSGLRSQITETPEDDTAFALVLVLLNRFATDSEVTS